MNVLISSAGRRVQLMECIRDSGSTLGVATRVLATDVQPKLSAACHLADRAFAVPRCDAPEFVSALLAICTAERVDLVIPTIDPELAVLSEHRTQFSAAGVDVVVSSPRVIALCRDKEQTVIELTKAGVRTPRTVSASRYAAAPSDLGWPVIMKPRGGSSSLGIVRPRSAAEAVAQAMRSPDAIVQELWRGREYTVNLFFDREGRLRCAIPHRRLETRSGEVSKGRTEDVPVLREMARAMAGMLEGARGPLCFQAIVTEQGEGGVFEINARFGGGYPLAHRAGARFTQWLIEEAAGLPLSAADEWKSGVTMVRFDAAVFADD